MLGWMAALPGHPALMLRGLESQQSRSRLGCKTAPQRMSRTTMMLRVEVSSKQQAQAPLLVALTLLGWKTMANSLQWWLGSLEFGLDPPVLIPLLLGVNP